MLTRRLFSEFLALKTAEIHRDALHFTEQANRWTFKEVHRHSTAYAKGLLEMGLKPGDTLSTWITCSEPTESYTVHLACYRAGLKILALSSAEDIEKALQSSSALIFSPWEDAGGSPRIDHILSKVPDLLTTPVGSLYKSKYPTKYFIQSGFRTIRGTYKLKTIPVYSSGLTPKDNFSFTYKGVTASDEDFKRFTAEISKVASPGDVIVNALPCKVPLSFASVAASLHNKSILVESVFNNPAEVVTSQGAKALVINEEKLAKCGGGFEVEQIVLGVESKDEVGRIVKQLESKRIKSKKILPYSTVNLSYLG